jgi:hypothetical protein
MIVPPDAAVTKGQVTPLKSGSGEMPPMGTEGYAHSDRVYAHSDRA